MKRSEFIILLLSLVLGFAGTCLYAEYTELPEPVRMEQAAWWGGLYPEYCLPGAMERIEEEELETAVPVKIRFNYLPFLNESE